MGALWMVLILGGFAVATYALAASVLGDRSTSVRLAATGIGVLWLLGTGFHLLAAAHAFTTAAAVALALVAGAVPLALPVTRMRGRTALAADRRAARAWWRGLGVPTQLLVVCVALFGLALVLPRALVTPPLGWDDLTYHLFKSGSWVNARQFVALPGPDASAYYDYFPATGEAVWAWFLVAAPSGTFLAVGALLPWGLAALAGYAAARRLDASTRRATLAALAIVTVPAAAAFLETSYVDNLELAGFLVGLVFLLECRRSFAWWPAFFALAALAFAAGTKSAAVPFFALGGVWLVIEVVRAGPPRRRGAGLARGLGLLALLALGAGLVAAPWYVRSAVDEGSPLYPLTVRAPGFVVHGDPQLDDVLAGRTFDQTAPAGVANVLSGLVDTEERLRVSDAGLNWEPFPPVFIVLGAVAVGLSFSRRSRRLPTAFLVVVCLLALQQVVSPDTYALRTMWANVLGRLLLPAFASLVLLVATLPWRWVDALVGLMAAAQLLISTTDVVRSWGPLDGGMLRSWFDAGWPYLLAVAVAVAAALVLRDRARVASAACAVVALLALVGLLGPPLEQARDAWRYRVYDAAGTSFDTYRVHPINKNACSWPLWQHLDRPEGATVAVTYGFDTKNLHDMYRFPFLGSALQNRVVFVPITRDGEVVNYEGGVAADRIDETAWLHRLRDGGVQYLALLPPASPEADLVARHPEVFRPVASGSCNDARLYAVDPAGIR